MKTYTIWVMVKKDEKIIKTIFRDETPEGTLRIIKEISEMYPVPYTIRVKQSN